MKYESLKIRLKIGYIVDVKDLNIDNLLFRIDIPESVQKYREAYPVAPVATPTMAGGLFAVDRKYFWEIGYKKSLYSNLQGLNYIKIFIEKMCPKPDVKIFRVRLITF